MPDFFTRAEAEAVLPPIRPLLHDLQEQWPTLVAATTALALLRQRMLGNGHGHAQEWEALKQQVTAARQRVDTLVAQVHAFGCLVKDPATGLIDFPAQLFGRAVYLCWQLGEERIAWWHECDAGFAQRQPL